MTKPEDKTMNLFNASGCLTAVALEKLASGGLTPDEAIIARSHIAGCELCSDALEGVLTWQKQNIVSEYINDEGQRQKNGTGAKTPGAFINKVSHINQRVRDRVKFHHETSSARQKRRIGPVPSWFAVAASVVLFAGIYLVLRQNRPSDKNLTGNQAEIVKTKQSPLPADTLPDSDVNSVLAENKPAMKKEGTPSPRIANKLVTINDNESVQENEPFNEYVIPAKPSGSETIPSAGKAVAGISRAGEENPITEIDKKADKADALAEESAHPATASKRSVSTATKAAEPAGITEEANQIFTVVEQQPEFPGGPDKLVRYLSMNLHYPDEAKENSISGTVYIQFVIEKTGQISDARVLRGIGYGCDEEALRVVKSMPRWKPGTQRGKPVKVLFNLPVKFSLE